MSWLAARPRLLGLFLLVSGLVVAYFAIYLPVMEARAGEAKVTTSMKGAVLCPLVVFVGLLYLILGDRAVEMLGTREAPTDFAWVLGILLAVLGFVVYFWLKEYLAQASYPA